APPPPRGSPRRGPPPWWPAGSHPLPLRRPPRRASAGRRRFIGFAWAVFPIGLRRWPRSRTWSREATNHFSCGATGEREPVCDRGVKGHVTKNDLVNAVAAH